MNNIIDIIFTVCATVAMIGLTVLLLAFIAAGVYGLWRMLTE